MPKKKICTTCGHGATKKKSVAKKPEKKAPRASVLAAAVLQKLYKRKAKR